MPSDQAQGGFRGDRVRSATSTEVNREIDQEMQDRVQRYAHTDPAGLEQRLASLEREWDIERVLELNASTLALTGLVLGLTVNRKWLTIPAIVLPFLLQHAIQGWCPPIPVLRRLGVRTQREIEAEKYALKSLQKRRSLRS